MGSFESAEQLLGVADLAKILKLTRATAHRYASTLVALGFLEQSSSRKYRLSSKAGDPGRAALGALALATGAQRDLERLRGLTGCTASLGVLDGAQVTYVQRFLAHGPGQYEADLGLGVGMHVPVDRTAIGMALLASLDVGEQQAILAGLHHQRDAPGTKGSRDDLAGELTQVRMDGVAVCEDGRTVGVRSIAAAIETPFGWARMAVSVSVPAGVHSNESLNQMFGGLLLTTAMRISARIARRSGGFTSPANTVKENESEGRATPVSLCDHTVKGEKRIQEMVSLRERLGVTYGELADMHGITVQRVNQLFERHAREAGDVSLAQVKKRLAHESRRAAALRAAYNKQTDILLTWRAHKTPTAIARELKLSLRAVAQLIANEASPEERFGRDHHLERILGGVA
jgi:IclR family pca regulon transcriptional regulator